MAIKKKQNSIFNYKRKNILQVLFVATGMFLNLPGYLLMFPTFSRSYVGISWILGGNRILRSGRKKLLFPYTAYSKSCTWI